jgi:hypothetical protein
VRVLQRDYLVDLRGVIEEGCLLAVLHACLLILRYVNIQKSTIFSYNATPATGTPRSPALWPSLYPASTAEIPRCSRIAKF